MALVLGQLAVELEMKVDQLLAGSRKAEAASTGLEAILRRTATAAQGIGFDPSTATGAGTAAVRVGALTTAAQGAATAASRVELPTGLQANATRAAGAVGDVGTAATGAATQVTGIGTAGTGAAQNVGQVQLKLADAETAAAKARAELGQMGASGSAAATDVARVSKELTAAEKAATQARTELASMGAAGTATAGDIGKIPSKLEQAEQRAANARAELVKLGASGTASASDVAKVATELKTAEAAATAARQEVGKIGEAGAEAGDKTGTGFISGFADKVGNLAGKAGPIGAALGGVAALGLTAGALLIGAIKEGMDVEVTQDLFSARTGLDQNTTAKFGRAAGEAYGNAFGESVSGNLDTAKEAILSGLLDPAATQAQAQQVIESLSGVSAILGEDIPRVARTAAQAVKNGIAGDAAGAFDLLVVGAQKGLNVSEDWLDTIDEYGTKFRDLGLTGPQAVGLLSQAVKAGARDTDTAADALKEFQIRATDGSATSSAGFKALGLDAQGMTAAISSGGAKASEGLAQVLEGLRRMPDPVARNTAAVALFGTKAEDMGKALYAMDLKTAADGMDRFAGAAATAIAVMGDNASSSVTGALNGISAAKTALEAALAQAVGPYIQDFANTVSNNREAVIGFFIDIANGAFEFGISLAGTIASAAHNAAELTGSLGSMASSGLNTLGMFVISAGEFMDAIPGMGERANALKTAGLDMVSSSFAVKDAAEAGASGLNTVGTTITDKVIPGLVLAQQRFNEFALPVQQTAAFNDVVTQTNTAITQLGVQSDGTTLALASNATALNLNNASQAALDGQLKGLTGSFLAQTRAGLDAGATVEELTGQFGANRQAIIEQLVATGLSTKAAEALTNKYGLVPNLVATQIKQPGMPEAKSELDVLKLKVLSVPNGKTVIVEAPTRQAVASLQGLGYTVRTLPNGQVSVTANTGAAEAVMSNFVNRSRSATVYLYTKEVSSNYSSAAARSGYDGRRAVGGPMDAGKKYLVGERGPEYVYPSRAGYVADAARTAELRRGAGLVRAAAAVGGVVRQTAPMLPPSSSTASFGGGAQTVEHRITIDTSVADVDAIATRQADRAARRLREVLVATGLRVNA